MLKISSAQMAMFEMDVGEAFIDALAKQLRTERAEIVKGLSLDELRGRVRFGVARARARGIRYRVNVAAFVTLMFVVAPRFDEHPKIQKRLEGGDDRDASFAWALRVTVDDEWLEAKAAMGQSGFPEEDTWQTT